jgi:acyl-CoA synthetase (AMP-forming)/AMP-acid ligase II
MPHSAEGLLAGADDACALYALDGTEITYGELGERSAAIATSLRAEHATLVCCRADGAQAIVTLLGSLEAGVPVMLLEADTSAHRAHELTKDFRPDVFVGWPGIAPLRIVSGGVDLELALNESGSGSGPIATAGTGPSSTALVLLTSGSTGQPKYVRLSREAVVTNAVSIAEALAISPEERAVQTLPLSYSYGLSVLTSHLRSGAGFVMNPHSVLTRDFWTIAERTGATSMAGVPQTYLMARRLLGSHAPASLRTFTQAGGRLDVARTVELAGWAQHRGGRWFTMYGQTEATARICVLPHERAVESAGSVGRAVPGGELSIVDDELVYRGVNVMLGYATSHADLAAGDLCGRTLRTGDLGRVDDDGLVWLTGRLGRRVKLFGRRFDLDDLERAWSDRGVIAVTEPGGSREDSLLVHVSPGATADAQQLAAELRVPARSVQVRELDALPLTSSGKTDYKALRT